MTDTAARIDLAVDDRLRFDGKATSWRVRATSTDGRYALATASLFGDVAYTVIDWDQGIRGPLNVIGHGMGIHTTSGPDERIDEAMNMLAGDFGNWEVSRRNNVPISITHHVSSVREASRG